MKLSTRKINGIEIEPGVNNDGEFSVTVCGRYLHAKSLDALIAQVRKETRQPKAKVELKYTQLDGIGRAENIVVTGIHAGHGAVLGYFERTSRPIPTERHRYGVNTVRRLTGEEAAEWNALCSAYSKAEKARSGFLDRVLVRNVEAEVRAAIAKALEAEGPADDEVDDPRTTVPKKKRR